MKPIQTYSTEAIDKLKEWICDMNLKGNVKYFEIYIDAIRVVNKTCDVDLFDSYENWVANDTQKIKVHTYNTAGSHRSTVFEFRTINYVPEVNYKEAAEVFQKKNEELTTRLSDAEAYIVKLETKSESSGKTEGFDLQNLFSMFGSLAKMNPEMVNSFGLGNLFGNQAEKPEKETEHYAEASFKRKESADAPKAQRQADANEQGAKLKPEELNKLSELNAFFIENPAYILVIHELIEVEKLKNVT